MKTCIATNTISAPAVPVALSGDFCENLRRAARYGYQAIEIHTPDISLLDIPALLQTMKEQHMQVATLGTGPIFGKYGLHLCDADPPHQELLFEKVRPFIDAAAALSSRVTIGSIKGNIRPDQDRREGMALLGHSLRRLDQYAQRQGVTLLLEATNRYENNVLNTARELRTFIESNRLSSTLALMDVFHMNIEEADHAAALDTIWPYLGHIHFADNNRMYPGAGCFNFAPFIKKLRHLRYDGFLSIECLPLPDSHTASEQAIRFLDAIC